MLRTAIALALLGLLMPVVAQAQTIKDLDEAPEAKHKAYVMQRMMDVSPRAKRVRIADRIYSCMMLMINTPAPSPLEQRRFMQASTADLYAICHKIVMNEAG